MTTPTSTPVRPTVTIRPDDADGYRLAVDGRPLPSVITAGGLGRALSVLSARAGRPISIHVHTADGRVLTDTISPPATGIDDPTQPRRFWPGEPVAVAAWIGRDHADWHGHLTPTLPRWARRADQLLLIGAQSGIRTLRPIRPAR